MQSSTFNIIEIYCTIVSVVKYSEIFQVYNNKIYTRTGLPSLHSVDWSLPGGQFSTQPYTGLQVD